MIANAIDIIDNNIDKAFSIGPVKDGQITNDDTISFTNMLPDIHEYIKPKLENHFKVKLKKTNDFGRIYTQGAALRNHKDSWHCQYSATINLLNVPSNGRWLFLTSIDNKNWTEYEMSPGDCVVYEGLKLNHKRNALEYEECYQWFFHYIEENGQYDNQHYYGSRYENKNI